jgi:AraC-like DNA-binding protein
MVTFVSDKVNFRDFLPEFALALNTPVINNRITLPAYFGNGYFAVEELPNGLLVLIIDYTLNTSLEFERIKSDEEYYSLRFETIRSTKEMVTRIEGDSFTEQYHERSIVYLTCSLFDLGYTASEGTYTRALSIQLPREWLARYMQMETYDTILEEYLSLKTASLLLEPVEAKYKIILDELKTPDLGHPAIRTIAHNRIMELIELFFINLYERRNHLKVRIKATAADIANVRKAALQITQNFAKPCPGIAELSREASMSATKLKKLFKDIYDKPIYQYYIYYRMLKARGMLLSGKYAVKEVAAFLGYENVSNFTIAFKKATGILPGKLAKF